MQFHGILITLPLINLKQASEKLREHFGVVENLYAQKHHLEAVHVVEDFKNMMESKSIPIDQQLSTMLGAKNI